MLASLSLPQEVLLTQECQLKEGVSQIVIVGSHSKIRQEIVRIGLTNVLTIEIEGKEHDNCP
jgi:hypothetical protein